MNLLEQLDAEIGEGPAHRPVDARLSAGRAAVRRRRVVTVSASLVAVVVAGTAVLLGGGSEPTAATIEPPIATQSSSSEPTPTPSRPQRRTTVSTDLVRLRADGSLNLARGVKVVQTVENPFGYTLPRRSVGLAITFRGETLWQLLESSPEGGSTSSDPARKAFATLEDWLADQVALQQGTAQDALVKLVGGRLEAVGSARIIEDRYDVDGFDALAEVIDVDERWYVVVKDGQAITVAGSVGGANLDAFIAYAKQQYASGEGLR